MTIIPQVTDSVIKVVYLHVVLLNNVNMAALSLVILNQYMVVSLSL